MTTTERPRRGRPRSFDREAALDVALRLFWTRGYEATSTAELTSAMGISMPSLYAAFGDKKTLFRETVAHYQQNYAITLDAEREGATARDVVADLLHDAAMTYADPAKPPGCLIISATANCTQASDDLEAELRAHRDANIRALERLIHSDIRAGHLPPDTDAHALARFFGATIQGMAQQARDGATRDELLVIARTALSAWPA
ncbi:TetR/AcrR family transcriptional regulator [Actinomadura vinacea]|uniref:TetR/AcrR family transcriptional regulator n=1 Tax=Actinomadura vinacea TaxID=115336 RepID=A0ABP5WN74_9ACTN